LTSYLQSIEGGLIFSFICALELLEFAYFSFFLKSQPIFFWFLSISNLSFFIIQDFFDIVVLIKAFLSVAGLIVKILHQLSFSFHLALFIEALWHIVSFDHKKILFIFSVAHSNFFSKPKLSEFFIIFKLQSSTDY